jgi:hypothetical protein
MEATMQSERTKGLVPRITLTHEMLDGTSETVEMMVANIPPTLNGRNVSIGSLCYEETMLNDRGWFKVGEDNQLTVFLEHSGTFAFFFDLPVRYTEICCKMEDKKGLYQGKQFAILRDMRCFNDNVGQNKQFSVLTTLSQQGQEMGLEQDPDANLNTLYTFLVEPEATRGSVAKSVTRSASRGLRGPPTQNTQTWNCHMGFGLKTDTEWVTVNRDPASETLTTKFRIKVLERDNKAPVPFTKQFTAPDFEPDPVPPKIEPSDEADTEADPDKACQEAHAKKPKSGHDESTVNKARLEKGRPDYQNPGSLTKKARDFYELQIQEILMAQQAMLDEKADFEPDPVPPKIEPSDEADTEADPGKAVCGWMQNKKLKPEEDENPPT